MISSLPLFNKVYNDSLIQLGHTIYKQSYFTQKYSLRNLPRLLFRLDYLHRKD